MEVLTEMDEYFNAMSKINMDEPVMPYVKGRLVESDTYNKVQKILNTPELEKAHMYCYDLDLENLEECDIMKINNLYKLGVDRGFIDDDLQYQSCEANDCCKNEEPKAEEPATQVNPRAKIPCFVAMYSAMKDGQIKTGEAYSRAISVQAAKADVMNQLSKFGYTNISILAVEATEEDACACTVRESSLGEDDMLKGRTHNGHLPEAEVEEDDMLDGRVHNNHIPEAEDDAADDSADDADSEEAADDSVEDDSTEDDSTEDDSTDEEAASDDASTEDTGSEDDSTDDSAEEEAGSEDDSAEDDSADDTGSEEAAEDGEEKEDAEASDDVESDDAEDADGEEDTEDELDDNKKADLKDNYKKTFKNTMLKCKFEDKTFDDLTIAEKVKFFTELSKTWKEDYEPSAFMSDKEIDQLNKITIKK